MELEIRHLRLICAIADAGSLSRAAAALKQTQPGVSAQLARIESMLGGRLFERLRTGVSTTALGDTVLARAKAVLPAFDEVVNLAAVAPRKRSAPSNVRLGCAPSPLFSGLIGAVQSISRNTEVTARLHPSAQALMDDIAAGRLEVAIIGYPPGFEPVPRAGVVVAKIAREPVFALLPSTHPMAGLDEVDLEALGGDDWAVPSREDRTSEYWLQAFQAFDRQPKIKYEACGMPLLELVRDGYAVSLCQPSLHRIPGLEVIPLTDTPLWTEWVALWHRDGFFSSNGEAMISQLRDSYDRISSAGDTT